MSNVIKIKRGSGSDPSASDLVVGELAVRTDNGKLFTKKDNGSVAELSGGAVSDGDITTAKLADDAVNADKLASNSVVSASIVDGSIVNADINASAAIAGSKISPDFGSQDIVTTGNLDLSDSSGSGNNRIKIGTGDDLQIFHTGSQSHIRDAGTGALLIQGSQVNIQNTDGTENMASFINDGAVNLYYDNSKKLETDSNGVTISGRLLLGDSSGANDNRIRLGADGDLSLFHSGTSSFILNDTGNLIISNMDPDDDNDIILRARQNESSIVCKNDAGVELYHNNVKKFETSSSGGTLTGNLDVSSGIDVTGNITATGDLTITNSSPKIDFVDAQQNPDFHIQNNNGVFEIVDTTNSQTIAKFENAKTTFVRNVDADAGLDITGILNVTNTAGAGSGTDTGAIIAQFIGDSDSLIIRNIGSGDYGIYNTQQNNGLELYDGTGGVRILYNGTIGVEFDNLNTYGDFKGVPSVNGTNLARVSDNITGNAATATKLANARTIAGVSFDGSANISLNNNAITNGAGYITSADGGNAATLDSIDSSQFARSDANDTLSGIITLSNTSEDCLNFSGNATDDDRGIAFNGRIAVSADYNDGYLRLNNKSEFGNGVYTPLVMRADGGFQVDSNTVINGSGQLIASRLTGALPAIDGSNLTNLPSSGLSTSGGTLTGTLNARTILPTANNTYDLGSSSARWRNIYTNDLNLSNKGNKNDIDSTWGSYTIQEGEEDLFLINRRNGKKYKFNLTEVS